MDVDVVKILKKPYFQQVSHCVLETVQDKFIVTTEG